MENPSKCASPFPIRTYLFYQESNVSSSIEAEPLVLSCVNLGRPFLGDNNVSGNLASLIQSKFTSSDCKLQFET